MHPGFELARQVSGRLRQSRPIKAALGERRPVVALETGQHPPRGSRSRPPEASAASIGERETCRPICSSKGVTGKDLTPFLLACIADTTDGASVEGNIALLRANARLAAEVSAAC